MPICVLCGSEMVERIGPRGRFWGCSAFPACRGSQSIIDDSDEDDDSDIGDDAVYCEVCGRRMVLREGHSKFWGCTGYPNCKNTKPYQEGSLSVEQNAGGTFRIDTPSMERDEDFAELEGIVLGADQRNALDKMENTRDNLFVTGKAGTGKSLLLKYFVKNTKKEFIVLAPTGVAAIRVNGQTIHSRFALNHEVLDPDTIIDPNRDIDSETKRLLQNIDVLIIDEVSMVRADLMECIERKFRLAIEENDVNRGLPFRGVRIILFGDLYQLQPVVPKDVSRYFYETYGGAFFFNAPVFSSSSMKLKIYELKQIYRQKEADFQEMLNEVRVGNASETTLSRFNTRYGIPIPPDTLTIATRNDKVRVINTFWLNQLPSPAYEYAATLTGNTRLCVKPTESILKLKVGAKVMILRNDTLRPMRWVNGTHGVVAALSEQEIKVDVNGEVYSIDKVTWHTIKYRYNERTKKIQKESIATFTQYPLCLAWALTIHKSQGQTYNTVAVDFGTGAFTHGQAYVALSRCQTLDGLHLIEPLRERDIIVDRNVAEFMRKFAAEPTTVPIEAANDTMIPQGRKSGLVVLVSCTKLKRNYPCQARLLYDASTLFVKSLAYAEAISNEVYVLSSKHGLVGLDEIIEPYEETLSGKSTGELAAWGDKVAKQISEWFDTSKTEFVILAGKNYYDPLYRHLSTIRLPLLGLPMGERLSKLDELLITERDSLCFRLHKLFTSMKRYHWDEIDRIGFEDGIYIIFENGESYKGMDRVVRVGTHTSDGRLKARLKDHFIHQNKDGSIFRKNIGRAILNKSRDPYLIVWNKETKAAASPAPVGGGYDRIYQQQIEDEVSRILKENYSFACFPVPNGDARIRLEEGVIAALNRADGFAPSLDWLGGFSPEKEIARSGLWLKQGLDGKPISNAEYAIIEAYCRGAMNDSIQHIEESSRAITTGMMRRITDRLERVFAVGRNRSNPKER